jgi:hypothetical protein
MIEIGVGPEIRAARDGLATRVARDGLATRAPRGGLATRAARDALVTRADKARRHHVQQESIALPTPTLEQ